MDYEARHTLKDALITCRFYRDIYFGDGLVTIIHGTAGMKLDR